MYMTSKHVLFVLGLFFFQPLKDHKIKKNVNNKMVLARSQEHLKLLFNILEVKIETFVLLVGGFSNILFIEGCRQRDEISK